MDDIIKLLQELMSKKPTPKGGIADTVAGVEFIGKKLSKEQIGDFTIIGSKLTDASRFRPFDVRNVGRDRRYMYMRDYADELQSNFEKTLRFIQDNPDIRLTQAQKDNVFYNLGVYRRVNAEKSKLEKGYIDEGKNPDEIYKTTDDERPLEELPFVKVLEKTKKTIDEFQKKVKETEDIFKPPSAEELSAGQIRYNKLYNGPGYESGNSSLYRGYGSSFLPRLHEKGIIKLDDEIYQNLKQGKHHWGGADFFAPDPIRIWRKHFGDDVFKKLDNFDPDNEDIFQWATRNNVQPTNKVGPKNALEYMNATEIGQRLTDEAELLNKYKNPGSQGENAKYYYADKPDQRMERITYHGENIQGYEQALQKMDPDAYNKYAAEFRQKTNDANVIPFNKEASDKQFFEDAKTSLENNKEYQKLKNEAGEGKFTKAQVLIERLKNTIKENPNDKYVQETFPGFIKEIEAKPELADDANVQEAFGLTDLSETTNQRLVEYPDGTLDFYTKGNQGGMESVQALIDELGISQEEAIRIKQLEPEDQILEITKLRTLKNKPEKAKGGRVDFNQGSNLKGIKQTFDDKTSEAFRVGNFTSALGYGPENYENLQAFTSMPVQDQNQALMTFRNLRSPDPLNSNKGPFEKQGFSSDLRHGLGTSAGKDAIIDYISSKTPIPANSRLANDLGIFGANIASLFEEGKDIFSSAKSYAERYPGITGIQDYDYVPDNKYLTQPFEDIAANYVGSKLPYGMSTPQKIAFLSNYKKYGNQTLDQVKNLELKKVQDTIKVAEQKEKMRIETLRRQRAAQEQQRQADQDRINRAYRQETGGQGGSYATGESGVQSDGSYNDPFDPGGGE